MSGGGAPGRGWRLAPLRRLREHEVRAAAQALGAALRAEAEAAAEVARRLQVAEAAARARRDREGRSAAAPSLTVAGLAGAAACAGRHAAALLEARAVALRAAGEAEARRARLVEARAAARVLSALEGRWTEARALGRRRAEERAQDDLPRRRRP